MGVVYRAEDVRLGRDVALKFLPEHLASDPGTLERFRREARAASRINHPHICTVHDIGEDEQGHPFLVMELLEGETLKYRLQRGTVPVPELLEWSSQIADALDAAHNAGIIHRDIKPANLFITARSQAKVLDFGLARSVPVHRVKAQAHQGNTETVAVDFQTSPGHTVGTVAYMSPEQARGEELDRRTDLFSMGVVMYEMATGEVPFGGNTSAVIFDAILNRNPVPVLERNPVVPAELGRIIDKALEKDRKLRYQSAAELRADLERLKRDSSTDRKPAVMTAHATVHRRSRAWFAIAGAVLLIVAAAVAALFFRRRPEQPIRELVPTRVTSNSSEAPVQTLALSPDGKYLAYSDKNGVHVRSMRTADSRVLPDTKGMSVRYWAADATQFFVYKPAGEQYSFYSISLAGGVLHPLGGTAPSPSAQYSVAYSKNHAEVRRARDGKVYSLDRKDAPRGWDVWSPHGKRLAIVFRPQNFVPDTIEVLDLESGRWTTVASSPGAGIGGIAWLSESQLVYAKGERALPMYSNLWTVDVDPSTGVPSGAPHRLTQWTDYGIYQLSASADGSRMCFLKTSFQADIYVGTLESLGTRFASARRLTLEEGYNIPTAWTPDSKAILFMSDRYGQLRIYKQDIDKDTADLIISGPGAQDLPRISPDGRWILYISDETDERPKTRLMRSPLPGGTAQEILSSDYISGLTCSHTAGRACVLAETPGKAWIFSLLDPIKGRGLKVLDTTRDDAAFQTITEASPAISPDGQHIAFVLPGRPRNRIRIVDLHGATEGEITVSGAQDLESLDWSADGTGFFSGDVQPDSNRLLHIDGQGASQVLWTQQSSLGVVSACASPDGRYLATIKANRNSNVWMVENP
jgi:serine/threonine protein kinase/Tol biopolymer transport system component